MVMVMDIVDSTELLRPGPSWQEIASARLCRPMDGMRMDSVDNRQEDSLSSFPTTLDSAELLTPGSRPLKVQSP